TCSLTTSATPRCRPFRRTTASSSRSRWPASGISRRSTAPSAACRAESMILVTGAGGFAGSHLLDLLVTSGADIVAWHRPGTAPRRENDRIAWQEVDLLDRLMVADAIRPRPPDPVYHLAGYAHVGRAWDETVATFEINVRGTHFLL